MKTLDTMVEKTGSCVAINGGFVVIDHTAKEEDNKGSATVVNVYSNDKKIRDQEINTVVRLFASGGGGKLDVGGTNFSFSYISSMNPCNDKPLINYKNQTKKIVVMNQNTGEFFLIMDERVPLLDAVNFIDKVNEEGSPLLKRRIGEETYNKKLQFPRPHGLGKLGVDGPPTFEVVMGLGLAVIKLEVV